MNRVIWDGKKRQLRGAIRAEWGRLTDDDLKVIVGRTERLIGRLEERYGYTRAQAEREARQFLERYGYYAPPRAVRIRRTLMRMMRVAAGSLAVVTLVAVAMWWIRRMAQRTDLDIGFVREELEREEPATNTSSSRRGQTNTHNNS